MGLDMYLYRRANGTETQAGYWRKTNHIHNWFVENVQNGDDDQREYFVSKVRLNELRNLCKKVLDNHALAPILLPTQSGFFFGATEYGEWYFRDLEGTVQILDRAIADPQGDYYYTSWW